MENLIGKKAHDLTIIKCLGIDDFGNSYFVCRRNYGVKNCDGKITKEYEAWKSMKRRCFNKHFVQYYDYGGRGITVCSTWINNFKKFLKDMGKCPDGFSLDRIDNNGNYNPTNCRWASRQQQCRNRRSNRPITVKGTTMLISDWAKELGINRSTITQALNTYNHSMDMIIKKYSNRRLQLTTNLL